MAKKSVKKKAVKKTVKKKVAKRGKSSPKRSPTQSLRVKKKVEEKKSSKRTVKPKVVAKRVSAKPRKTKVVRATKKKFKIVLNNLFLFLILFIISFALYALVENEVYSNLFYLTALGTGFLTIAFLIILLIFVFLRMLRK